MPSNTVTCPFCNATLKSKAPVPGGTKVKCPGCSTQFVVRPDDAEDVPPTVAAPKKAAPRPAPAVAPKPAAAAKPAAPKPPAPKPAAVTAKPAAKPAAARPAPKPPAKEEDLIEVADEDVVEVADDEVVEITDDAAVEITEPLDDEEPLEEADDGPRRRRKKAAKGSGIKGIPLWVWLTGGGVLAVVVLGSLVLVVVIMMSFLGSHVSMDNFDKIKLGSSEAEVTAILGSPAQRLTAEDVLKNNPFGATMPPGVKMPDTKTLVWKSGEDFISVEFVKDKAGVKICQIGGATKTQADTGVLLGGFGP